MSPRKEPGTKEALTGEGSDPPNRGTIFMGDRIKHTLQVSQERGKPTTEPVCCGETGVSVDVQRGLLFGQEAKPTTLGSRRLWSEYWT